MVWKKGIQTFTQINNPYSPKKNICETFIKSLFASIVCKSHHYWWTVFKTLSEMCREWNFIFVSFCSFFLQPFRSIHKIEIMRFKVVYQKRQHANVFRSCTRAQDDAWLSSVVPVKFTSIIAFAVSFWLSLHIFISNNFVCIHLLLCSVR